MPGPPPGAAAFSDVLAELLLPRDMEPEDDAEEDGGVEEDDDGMLELEDGERLDVELPVLPEPELALPAAELPLLALLAESLLLELLPPDFDLSTPPWWLHAPRPLLADVVPSLHMTGALVEPDALLVSCALSSGAIEMRAPSAAMRVSSLRRFTAGRG
jgi:hypothetical protein